MSVAKKHTAAKTRGSKAAYKALDTDTKRSENIHGKPGIGNETYIVYSRLLGRTR